MNSFSTDFRIVYSTPFFDLEEDAVSKFPNGLPYYRLTGNDSAMCCLMDGKGELLMVRQFRPSVGFHTMEFPAGSIEPGETPSRAVRREIEEETGISAQLLELGTFGLETNRSNIMVHLFFGMDLKPIPGHVAESGMEVFAVPRKEFSTMVGKDDYIQLAGLGILQLVSISLDVDILRDPVKVIRNRFNKKMLDVEN